MRSNINLDSQPFIPGQQNQNKGGQQKNSNPSLNNVINLLDLIVNLIELLIIELSSKLDIIVNEYAK